MRSSGSGRVESKGAVVKADKDQTFELLSDRETLEREIRHYCEASGRGGIPLSTTVGDGEPFRFWMRISIPDEGSLELECKHLGIKRIEVIPRIRRGEEKQTVRQWAKDLIDFLQGNEALKPWPEEYYAFSVKRRERLAKVRNYSRQEETVKAMALLLDFSISTVKNDRKQLREWAMI